LVIVALFDKGTYEPLAIAIGCLAGIAAAMIPGLINRANAARKREIEDLSFEELEGGYFGQQ
jgi:xanthine/uracil permease